MDGTAHIVLLVEVAGGIILGLVIWSYVSPMISSATVTPAA